MGLCLAKLVSGGECLQGTGVPAPAPGLSCRHLQVAGVNEGSFFQDKHLFWASEFLVGKIQPACEEGRWKSLKGKLK